MPTKTFFNLSDEKRERLIDAATTEFSNKSLNEASINVIIKNASVSRGSFYQYFEDKEDLYFYIVKRIKLDSDRLLKESIVNAEGDIFDGFRNYFPLLLNEMMNTKNIAFFKQFFLHLDYRATKEVTPEDLTKHEEGSEDTKNFFSIVNIDQLQVTSRKELLTFFRLILSLMSHEIIEGFAKSYSQDKIIEHFYQKLNWLEHGAKKEKNTSGGNK